MVPVAQERQDLEPLEAAKEPAGQLVHVDIPSATELNPAGHSVQVAAAAPEKDPAVQFVHAVTPDAAPERTEEYIPAVQEAHCVPPVVSL